MCRDVFGAVPDQELRRAGRRRRFNRGEVVFHRDDPGDSLHRVESGRFAARIITPPGDSATVALHGPGETFGLLAVIGAAAAPHCDGDRPRRRRDPCARGEATFTRLRLFYPAVQEAVDQLIVAQLAATNERLMEALYTPAADRVRTHLMELARCTAIPMRGTS